MNEWSFIPIHTYLCTYIHTYIHTCVNTQWCCVARREKVTIVNHNYLSHVYEVVNDLDNGKDNENTLMCSRLTDYYQYNTEIYISLDFSRKSWRIFPWYSMHSNVYSWFDCSTIVCYPYWKGHYCNVYCVSIQNCHIDLISKLMTSQDTNKSIGLTAPVSSILTHSFSLLNTHIIISIISSPISTQHCAWSGLGSGSPLTQ